MRLGELGTPVTLIGEEEHRPYNRVLLAEVLAGRYSPEVIALPAPADLVRARVTGIDRDGRTVECADGSKIAYDTLVLATGSNPVLPPLRGLFTPTTCSLRASTPSAPWTTAWACPRRSGRVRRRSSSAAGCSESRRPARSPCAAPRSSSPSSPSG